MPRQDELGTGGVCGRRASGDEPLEREASEGGHAMTLNDNHRTLLVAGGAGYKLTLKRSDKLWHLNGFPVSEESDAYFHELATEGYLEPDEIGIGCWQLSAKGREAIKP